MTSLTTRCGGSCAQRAARGGAKARRSAPSTIAALPLADDEMGSAMRAMMRRASAHMGYVAEKEDTTPSVSTAPNEVDSHATKGTCARQSGGSVWRGQPDDRRWADGDRLNLSPFHLAARAKGRKGESRGGGGGAAADGGGMRRRMRGRGGRRRRGGRPVAAGRRAQPPSMRGGCRRLARALESWARAWRSRRALEAARGGRGGRSSTPASRAAAPEVDDATPEGGGAAGSSPSPPCGALMAGCVAREGGGWRTEHRAGQRRGCGSGTRVRALPRCRAGVPDPADVAGSRGHGAASVMRCEPGLTDRARWLLPLSGFSWAALPPRHA